ncbi:MAG: DUF6088 family protein [Azoarcus sp.]|nr:DUF6088 family protein [Azoarcus sp.]
MSDPMPALPSQVMQRIIQAPASTVWTPGDFLDLGGRDAVDKALQRLTARNDLRRIDRGLYDRPRLNALTRQMAAPDYLSVIEAIGRRDQLRVMIDGMTAANDLGLTNAVPGQVIVLTDGRLRPIRLGNMTLRFKPVAPSKLYWAGRAAMRVVQSLYWLRDGLKTGNLSDQEAILAKLARVLRDPRQGAAIRDDLREGLRAVPAWMQKWVGELLARSEDGTQEASP